jgi:hypothetical protein
MKGRIEGGDGIRRGGGKEEYGTRHENGGRGDGKS